MSQPGLSQQIRRLEQELGGDLFDRRSRPIQLTAVGRVFMKEAKLAVGQAGQAVESGRRAARGELGALSVGTTYWAYNAIVPAVARSFHARAPAVSLDISTAPPTVQVDALHNQRLDICFLAFAQWLTGMRALAVEPLLEEPMVAIVGAEHPLAERAEVSLADLAEEPFIALSHAIVPGLVDSQMAMFHDRGLFPRQVQETSDPLAMFSLIGAGVGVGLHMASFSKMGHPGIVFIPLEGNRLTATLLMVWRRDDDREILRTFLDAARDCARSTHPARVQPTATRRAHR